MITSLNINQAFNENTLAYINNHLQNDDDLVLLHEVTQLNIDKIKATDLLYFESYYPNTAKFKTIAVVTSNKNFENIELQPFILSQKNRTIFILKSNRVNGKTITTDLIVGLHAPSHNVAKSEFASISPFGQSLIEMIEKIISYRCLNCFGFTKKINDIIIMGDLNAYIPGTERKRFLNKLLSVGFVDLWIETNNKNNHYTYSKTEKGSRIDYALISDDAWEKYSIEIDDTTRSDNGFTDHSAIKLKKI